MFSLFGILQKHNIRLVLVQDLSFPCNLWGEVWPNAKEIQYEYEKL